MAKINLFFWRGGGSKFWDFWPSELLFVPWMLPTKTNRYWCRVTINVLKYSIIFVRQRIGVSILLFILQKNTDTKIHQSGVVSWELSQSGICPWFPYVGMAGLKATEKAELISQIIYLKFQMIN